MRAHLSAEHEAMTTTTKEKTAPAVAPVVHKHDKALNDALSAIGRIEAKLGFSLKRARLLKSHGQFEKVLRATSSSLTEAEASTLNLHCAVVTLYDRLDEAIAKAAK